MNIIDNSAYLKDFGRFVKEGREKKKLYQENVAEQLNITQSYYSKIERGVRNVDLVLAMEICKILDLDINEYIRTYME